jgi:four helix bundle protein
MKDFRRLDVWPKAHRLTLDIYRLTKTFPFDERFGLTSQMRRCSASIAANISEGCGRGSNADFHRFLQMAMGSASELEYHLLLSRDLGYLADGQHAPLHEQGTEVKRMLTALLSKVERDQSKSGLGNVAN